MFEGISDSALVALIGMASGLLLGLAARLGRFCTMGAIEDMLYGQNDTRMRMWVLAIGLSVIGTFGLMATGLLEPERSFYLSIRWMPVVSIIGGLMFGYGMALAGNCGFGSIARLGGGDMRAFVIVLVMGLSAYFVMSGPLAPLRALLINQQDVVPGEMPPGLAHLLSDLTGGSVAFIGMAIGALIVLGTLSSRRFLTNGRAIFWSAVVALGIVSGWAGSYWVATTGW